MREEIEHVRESKHGARSAKQAIATGLSQGETGGGETATLPGKKVPKATGRKPNLTVGVEVAAQVGSSQFDDSFSHRSGRP